MVDCSSSLSLSLSRFPSSPTNKKTVLLLADDVFAERQARAGELLRERWCKKRERKVVLFLSFVRVACSLAHRSSALRFLRPRPLSSHFFFHKPKKKKKQIEHALNAVNAGATALGIRAVDGVVLATEKKARSPLVDCATISKLSPVTPNSGLAYAGMGPDSRVLVRRARKSAQAYLRTYGEEIPVAQLCRETAAVMQEFTQRGGVRPFGVSLLMTGVDAGGGPQLYQIDPSGSYFAWKASAVGKNAQDAR